jgi:hypothetical protein
VNVDSATARLVSGSIESLAGFGSDAVLDAVAKCVMAPTPVVRARIVASRPPMPSLSKGSKSQVMTFGVTVHLP